MRFEPKGDSMLEQLAMRVIDWIENRADEDWQSLIDEDNEAIPDENALIHAALEDLQEWLADTLGNHPAVQKAIEQARVTIRETAAEHVAYNRAMNGTVNDQLKWHGMSVKDFI